MDERSNINLNINPDRSRNRESVKILCQIITEERFIRIHWLGTSTCLYHTIRLEVRDTKGLPGSRVRFLILHLYTI